MKVYLMTRPQFLWDGWNNFLMDEGLRPKVFIGTDGSDSERIVEVGGRLCYMSFGKGRKTRKEFIDNLIKSGHHSVLEHANWSLLFTGVSRSLTHELVRHRHFSFSQLSQRYVDHSEMKMIRPKGLGAPGTTLPALADYRFHEALQRVQEVYKELMVALGNLENGTAKETTLKIKAIRTAARAVLPNAMETKILVTGNTRAWREFIQKRNTEHADPEIRELAARVLDTLEWDAPLLFGDLRGQDVVDAG